MAATAIGLSEKSSRSQLSSGARAASCCLRAAESRGPTRPLLLLGWWLMPLGCCWVGPRSDGTSCPAVLI
eukprot:scaffold40_cov66-Phaeocystis_antarctica.AAC.17